MTAPVVGFAGLTHLGLVSAAATGRKFRTIAFDVDEDRVERIKAMDLPVEEPGLEDLVKDNGERLAFAAEPSALSECDVIFISVDVPTDDAGESSLAPIRTMIDAVAPVAKIGAVIVVLSQVPPGFTRNYAENDPRFFYQVETLVFGNAVERALNPERIIVGCAEPGSPLPAAYGTLLDAFACPILAMAFESAELAKISINVCLVASISAANAMAEICETVGADWSEIAPALKLYKRIGEFAYLKPGLGLAGGNLERDIATITRLARAGKTDAGIFEAWTVNSRRRRDWALEKLRESVLDSTPDAAVCVLGLAYKENTHSTKNSPALALISNLGDCQVSVFDPVVPGDAAGPGVTQATSALEAAQGADVVLIMTPWPEFRDIDPAELAKRMKGNTLIDPYRVLDAGAVAAASLNQAVLGKLFHA